MRCIILFLGLLLIYLSIPNCVLSSQTDWIIVNKGADDTTMYTDMQFIGKNGWIVGSKWNIGGVILRTTDGGNKWSEDINKSVDIYGFRAVHFINENEGWVVSGGEFDLGKKESKEPYIFHTINGGDTWTPMNQKIIGDPFNGFLQWLREPSSLILGDVFFTNSTEGWLIGGPDVLMGTAKGFLFHTSDGGKTWTGQHFTEILTKVYSITPEQVWLFAESALFNTTNAGGSWDRSLPIGNGFIHPVSLQFISQEEGWLIESHGDIYHTTDSGKNWEIIKVDGLNFFEPLCGGFFINSNDGWTVSDRGKILYTIDGGKHWQILDDVDLVRDFGIRLHDIEYVSSTGEICALGRGLEFEPYILRHPINVTSVNPLGKMPTIWGKIKSQL